VLLERKEGKWGEKKWAALGGEGEKKKTQKKGRSVGAGRKGLAGSPLGEGAMKQSGKEGCVMQKGVVRKVGGSGEVW